MVFPSSSSFSPPPSPPPTTTTSSRSLFSRFLFNVSEDALAGAFAGLVARTLTAPFDVIKIRYQLLCRRVTHTPSMMHAFQNIIKEEGVTALWKGNLAATYLWISYAVVQFGVYGMMKDWLAAESQQNSTKLPSSPSTVPTTNGASLSLTNKAALMFLAGSIAGTTATIATYPFDITRTQFAVQGKTKTFPSMASYITQTFKTYGIKGFYSGLGPAVIGVTPYIGLNFAFYETLKSVTTKFHNTNDKVSNVIVKGMLGGVAGGSAKFLMYPLDTVKKRLQAQTLQSSISELFQGARYKNMPDCFATIWKQEGLRGFYRGIIPTMAKAVSASAITFMAYEGAKEVIKFQKLLILDNEKEQPVPNS